MTTLYKRATPTQRQLLRIIEGATRNAIQAHHWNLPDTAPRSVAKRAVGTLTAAMPVTLAVSRRSERRASIASKERGNACLLPGQQQARGASDSRRRTPFFQVIKLVSGMIGQAKRDGKTDVVEALIEVMRALAP